MEETQKVGMKFRKKPIEIEAFRFRIDPIPDWFQDEVTKQRIYTQERSCSIDTDEGSFVAVKGDWIIKGIEGEIYPCRDSIFKKSYEPIIDEWTQTLREDAENS